MATRDVFFIVGNPSRRAVEVLDALERIGVTDVRVDAFLRGVPQTAVLRLRIDATRQSLISEMAVWAYHEYVGFFDPQAASKRQCAFFYQDYLGAFAQVGDTFDHPAQAMKALLFRGHRRAAQFAKGTEPRCALGYGSSATQRRLDIEGEACSASGLINGEDSPTEPFELTDVEAL